MIQVGNQFTGINISDDSADRHAQYNIFRTFTIAICATPGFTIARAVMARKTVIHQGVDVAVCERIYAATPTAIPAIGAALVDIFFSPKAGRTVAAIACDDFNF